MAKHKKLTAKQMKIAKQTTPYNKIKRSDYNKQTRKKNSN